MPAARLAYLYSRYPVVSQTFCDSEMLALEGLGYRLVVGSLYPPKESFRHERLRSLAAPVHYPPPPATLKGLQAEAEKDGTWPAEMIRRHDAAYGPSFQSAVRARNALWFAKLFQRLGVGHVHVHFANRATHTALFLKAISGITFSFTPHAQDFMVDLGSDALLAELCREATAVVAVSDFSLGLLRQKCPESAGRMQRVYNGLDLSAFPAVAPRPPGGTFRVLSIGRLIEFKGFHHLLPAMAGLRDQGIDARLEVIGEGPWRERLENQCRDLNLDSRVEWSGARSQEEIKSALARAHVFALACTTDGKGATDILPTVIAEAMASGLPVVSTRLAGVPEMVDDGKSGLLADPGDINGLTRHLAALAASPALAEALGQAGKVLAGEKFSLAVTAPALAGVLSQNTGLPSGPAAPPPDAHPVWLVYAWPVGGESAAEVAWAKSRGFQFLAAGSGDLAGAGPSAGSDFAAADYLPDGMVLEAAWKAHPDWAARCEAWRHDLGSAVDGEWFFRLARRAVWLAEETPKRGWSHFHGARGEESCLAWLAARLTGRTFSGALGLDGRPSPKLVALLKSEAKLLADAAGDDPLGLRPPATPKRGWFRSADGPPASGPDRHRALDQWFAGHLPGH